MIFLQILTFLRVYSGGDGCGHVWKGEEKIGRGWWDEGEIGFSGKVEGMKS